MPEMRHGRSVWLAATLAALIAPAGARADDSRYALANGCYALTSHGTPVGTDVGPFRMKATALGSYMLYGAQQKFLARMAPLGTVGAADTPSDDADWTVDGTTGAFTLTLAASKQQLANSPTGLTALPS